MPLRHFELRVRVALTINGYLVDLSNVSYPKWVINVKELLVD